MAEGILLEFASFFAFLLVYLSKVFTCFSKSSTSLSSDVVSSLIAYLRGVFFLKAGLVGDDASGFLCFSIFLVSN
jgi:hypothetical protein